MQPTKGLIICDHFCSGSHGGYVGFNFALGTGRGKLVISSKQHCFEVWRSYIMFDGNLYQEAKDIPDDVVRRIRKLVVTDVALSFPESTTDDDEQLLELTFTAFDQTNDEKKQVDVRLIVSNSHNGYYSHNVMATYNGRTYNEILL
jgi:hypothetical protein